MQKGTWSVAAASALGAFLGGLTALELAQRLGMSSVLATLCALSIGALVGGFVGWCAVDFQQLLSGIQSTWHKTISWTPNGAYWKFVLANMAFFYSVFAVWVFGLISLAIILSSKGQEVNPTEPSAGKALFFALIVSSGLGAFATLIASLQGLGHKIDALREMSKVGLSGAKWDNPISVICLIILYTISTLKWICTTLVPNLPRWTLDAAAAVSCVIATVACELWDFACTAFVFVHSNRRTICFIAATIGAVVGFCFGSALIGAVVGALLGAVQHELVAVRWLKLVPVGAEV